MSHTFKAVIIDDERLARREMTTLLSSFDFIEIAGEAGDVASAVICIEETDPDILFLDIQMPGESGFDLLDKIDFTGHIVFITAFDEYAIRAFEINALDYLLKPVSAKRLEVTLERIRKGGDETISRKNLTIDDRLFVMVGNHMKFIKVSDILCIRAEGDYSKVVLRNLTGGLVLKTMQEWEKRLPANHFCRVHRSTIVGMEYIDRVEKWMNYSYRIFLKGLPDSIVLSRRYARRIKYLLG